MIVSIFSATNSSYFSFHIKPSAFICVHLRLIILFSFFFSHKHIRVYQRLSAAINLFYFCVFCAFLRLIILFSFFFSHKHIRVYQRLSAAINLFYFCVFCAFLRLIILFFREAMTIFVRRSPPDKCLCPSVCVCG